MTAPPALPDGSSVTVVIPTFNRAAELMRALGALQAQTAAALHAIVVDNSSTDDTEARVRACMPHWQGRLHYLRKDPQGPASARNLGLAAATTPLVLFQDSDVELEPQWVERALSHFQSDPQLAAAGGLVIYAFDRSRVNAYGGDLGRMGLAWDIDEGALRATERAAAGRIWINCSAMLVRARVVQAIGGFDETFFYGYEDSDLGWRLNLAGHRVAVFPDLAALHHVDADVGVAHPTIVFHYCKNRLRSLLRNAAMPSFIGALGAYLAYSVVDLVWRAPRRPKIAALVWNLRRWRQTLALRRQTQAQRQVPDTTIFALGAGRWLPPTPLGNRRRRPLPGADKSMVTPADRRDDRV